MALQPFTGALADLGFHAPNGAGGGSGFRSGKEKKDIQTWMSSVKSGAGDGARTRYLHLGKVALYQMSYARRTVLL